MLDTQSLDTYIQRIAIDCNLYFFKEGKGYSYSLDPLTKILITPMAPGISFFSIAGTIPKGKEKQLLIEMMEANLFGQGTKGSVLGLNENREGLEMTLSFYAHQDLSYQDFKDKFEDFCNSVDVWKEEIA
jgi:hypothetical protein